MLMQLLRRPTPRAKWAKIREVAPSRRRSRWTVLGWLERLEIRQLLSGIITETVSYHSSVPLQLTDYSKSLTLPKFDPALGTLTHVGLQLAAGGENDGTVTNNGLSPRSFSLSESIDVSLEQGSSVLLTPNLFSTQTFTNLPGGGVGQYGPFSPISSTSVDLTSGAVFDSFASGPGTVPLTVATNTTQTTTGNGGNIASVLNTSAGAIATVTYTYNVGTVSLSGTVYEDVNATQSLTPGDLPIPGTVLTLLNSSGTVVATTTTGANGNYAFTTDVVGGPLLAGTYSIVEAQPAGYLQGTNTVGTVNGVVDGVLPATDVIGSIVLTQGQDSVGNNFGEVKPIALTGTVYDDVLGLGSLQPGDLPIGGVTLRLFDATGLVATTTTGVNGGYAFTTTTLGAPLAPGTYTVAETQPAGYLQGTNTVGTVNGVVEGKLTATDIIGSIGLRSSQVSVSNNFGEVKPVALTGTVYNDVNRNGSLNPGDLPIGGVTLDLYGSTGLVATTTTGVNGDYAFTTTTSGSPLAPGTYAVAETQPAGYLQGTNTVGTVNGVRTGNLPLLDVIGSIGLKSGQVSVGNNFGELLAPVASPSLILTNVQRFGVHLQPTLIVLTFNTPLNPATAQNVANYQIFGPTDSKHPASIPIISAVYNPATDMVTLHLGARLQVHHPYRLTINGIVNSTGSLLVGSNGVAGSTNATTLDRSQLSGFTDIYGNFIPINHGKLYPAAKASGYQLQRFREPTNLGTFAANNKATFLAATQGSPQPAPITLLAGRKLPKSYHV